jgi:hypothetical protein
MKFMGAEVNYLGSYQVHQICMGNSNKERQNNINVDIVNPTTMYQNISSR